MVEIKNSAKPVTSCTTNVMDKMVIFTDSPLVKKARENIMEFLLLNHPLDCPICDQGGECDLQDLSLNFGSDKSRFFNFKRIVEDKHCGPIIKTIMTRCIHCTKCVRFLTEICDYPLYGTVGRGTVTEISTFLEKNLNNELSGNLIDLCPVGALTSKVESFVHRPWELTRVNSVDFFDPIGTTVSLYTRNSKFIKDISHSVFSDTIIRVLPKPNFWINMDWLTDKSRFSYQAAFKNRNFYILENNMFKKSWYSLIKHYIVEKPIFYYDKKKQHFKGKPLMHYFGLFLDSHSIIFPDFFFKLLGRNKWLVNGKQFLLNTDIPYFYRTNTWFNDIANFNIFLFLNIDIRYESPILHLYCRKAFLTNNSLFFVIGNFSNTFFPFKHLGYTSKIFYDIAEGRHFLCEIIRKTKNVIFFLGNNFLYKEKSKMLYRTIHFFIKKSFLNIKNFESYNFVLNNNTKMNIAELGLVQANNLIFQEKNYYNSKTEEKAHFIFQDTLAFQNLKKKNKQKIYFFYPHFIKNADFLIPTKTLYEKEGFMFNLQGRVRFFPETVTHVGMSAGIDTFFSNLYFYLQRVKQKSPAFKTFFLPLFYNNYYPLLFQKFIKDMDKKLKKKKKIKFNKLVLISQYTIYFTRGFFQILFSKMYEKSVVYLKHSSFFKLIKNFYTDNFLSANSTVLVQAFMLQKHGINFKQTNWCF